MSSKSQRLVVAAALTAACAAGAMAAGPAAQAVEADRPNVQHALADDYDYSPWRPWRFVGEFRNAFLCNGQGAALILSGGARDFRCAEDDGSYELFIR
ncbi:hypothetical protein ACQEU3_44420 [Spirillospora sp. CA-253888]